LLFTYREAHITPGKDHQKSPPFPSSPDFPYLPSSPICPLSPPTKPLLSAAALAEEFAELTPKSGEHTITKNYPGSFTQTDLDEHLKGLGEKGKQVVLTGVCPTLVLLLLLIPPDHSHPFLPLPYPTKHLPQ
jgi:nicotinamidase-related amidase